MSDQILKGFTPKERKALEDLGKEWFTDRPLIAGEPSRKKLLLMAQQLSEKLKAEPKRQRRRRYSIINELVESVKESMPGLLSKIDPVDAAIMAGCAYFGWQAMGEGGLITGPVAYKLATTPGGMSPINSQTVGLGILAAIGIINMGGTGPTVKTGTAGMKVAPDDPKAVPNPLYWENWTKWLAEQLHFGGQTA